MLELFPRKCRNFRTRANFEDCPNFGNLDNLQNWLLLENFGIFEEKLQNNLPDSQETPFFV